MSDVDYCVTTMDRPQALERLLHSVAAHQPEAQISVADQSKDFDPGFHDALGERLVGAGLRDRPSVHRLPFDCGVSAARNHLAKATSGNYKLVLDDDFVFTDRTDIDGLARILDTNPEAGVVGGDVVVRGAVRITACQLVIEGDTLSQSETRSSPVDRDGLRVHQVDCVPMFMLMRKELCEAVQWDPELKTSGEHFDFFLRVRQTPFVVLHTPDAMIEHPPAPAAPSYRNRRLRGEFLERMLRKHGLRRQRSLGGAVFELDPDDELIAYCEIKGERRG